MHRPVRQCIARVEALRIQASAPLAQGMPGKGTVSSTKVPRLLRRWGVPSHGPEPQPLWVHAPSRHHSSTRFSGMASQLPRPTTCPVSRVVHPQDPVLPGFPRTAARLNFAEFRSSTCHCVLHHLSLYTVLVSLSSYLLSNLSKASNSEHATACDSQATGLEGICDVLPSELLIRDRRKGSTWKVQTQKNTRVLFLGKGLSVACELRSPLS